MSTTRKLPRAVRWGIALVGLAALVAIWLVVVHMAPLLAGGSRPHNRTEPQVSRRKFIGLPDVSTVSVQNLLTIPSNITATFALASGTPISSVVDSLTAESFAIYSGPQGADHGLIEIEAEVAHPVDDLPIFATSFELAESGNDAYLGAGFQAENCAVGHGTSTLCMPLAVKEHRGSTTRVVVQNEGSMAGTVFAGAYDEQGDVAGEYVATIQARGSLVLSLADFGDLDTDFVGSLVVESDQPLSLAASVRADGPPGLCSNYAVGIAGTVLVAPVLFSDAGFQTSELCVQNAYYLAQTALVAYSDGLDTSATLPPRAAHCFDQGTEGHESGWTGGAVISASFPLLAAVNVTAKSGGEIVGRWSYAVPPQHQLVSGAVALPLLLSDYQQWTTAIHLYNFGDSPAVITPRYVSYAGFNWCAEAIPVPAGSTISISQSELLGFMDVSVGYLLSTQPVAAVVSATSSKHVGDTDRHFGYEAGFLDTQLVPQASCDTVHEVFLPVTLKGAP